MDSVSVPLGINLHDTFSSAEEINNKISQLCKEKSVQLYKRDSRTIESAIKKKIKRYMDPNLKFYQIKYACIYGGLNFKCRGTGQRNKKTLKKDEPCPAFIVFTISKSGNNFEVTNINNSHNHRVIESGNEEVAKIEMNLDVTCRGCLSENKEMHDLFAKLDGGLKLADILEITTSFEVKEDDGLSHYLCEKCAAVVVDFYNFKLVFQETEQYIQLLLNNLKYENISSLPSETNSFRKDKRTSVLKGDIKLENKDCYEPFKEKAMEVLLEPSIVLLTEEQSQVEQTMTKDIDGMKQIVKFTCQICSRSYTTKYRFKEHMYNQHNEKITNYRQYFSKTKECDNETSCLTCDTTFETHEELIDHRKTHRNFICEQCGAGFTKNSILSDHMASHATTCRFICPFCGKGFRHRSPFSKHKMIHTNPGHAVCDTCGRRFNDKATLKTHIQLIHIRSRNFLCPDCGLSFPLRATLRKHQLRKHIGNREQLFKCQYCTMAYKDKSSLNRHIIVIHDDSAPKPNCNLCGRVYTTTTNLSKHMRRHHGGKTPSPRVADGPKDGLKSSANVTGKVVTERFKRDLSCVETVKNLIRSSKKRHRKK